MRKRGFYTNKVLKQLTHGNNRESPPNTLTADIFNSYYAKIGVDTVSHLLPTLATGVDGGQRDCFGADQTAHVVLILQRLNNTLSVKNTFLS